MLLGSDCHRSVIVSIRLVKILCCLWFWLFLQILNWVTDLSSINKFNIVNNECFPITQNVKHCKQPGTQEAKGSDRNVLHALFDCEHILKKTCWEQTWIIISFINFFIYTSNNSLSNTKPRDSNLLFMIYYVCTVYFASGLMIRGFFSDCKQW